MNKREVTQEMLLSILSYDPGTGVFTWLKSLGPRGTAGNVAGHRRSESGRRIEIGGLGYNAHYLAWVYHYGTQPSGKVHHINGDRDDNRIANLADVDISYFRRPEETELTADRLRQLLTYDPKTGVFTWNIVTGHRKKTASTPKGDSGYSVIVIDGRVYRAHRLAWLYFYGVWPKGILDHINGDRADNRISNLRGATPSENSGNTKLLMTNTSGYRGVFMTKEGNWMAKIVCHGEPIVLGTFKTVEEAHAAYLGAAKVHFREFCPTGKQIAAILKAQEET